MNQFARYLAYWILLATSYGYADAGNWTLIGEARLKVMFWDVYTSRLYSRDGQYSDHQRPIKLEIQYLRAIKAHALIESTRKEWARLGFSHPHQQQWLKQLTSIWPDIQPYDVLAIQLDKNQQSVFLFNGLEVGQITDPDFGRHFLDIWLSPNTSQPQLRLALLGEQ